MTDTRSLARELGQLVLALGVSLAISVVAIYFAVPLFARVTPQWLAQSLMTAMVAAVWMWAGLVVAPKRASAAIALFLAAAASAAYFLRGNAYSVSAYYGIVPFGLACLGGAMSWFTLAIQNKDEVSRRASLAVPLVTAIVFASVMLARPTLGFTRRMLHSNGSVTREHMIVSARTDFTWYMWRNAGASAIVATDTNYARVETHPKAGVDNYSLTLVRDPASRANACTLLRASDSDLIESEMAEGAIPRWITALPYHEVNCDTGDIWHLIDKPK